MPSVSKSQQRLFGAVEGGAKFPLAKKIRSQMTSKQVHDFAATKRRNLPDRIKPPKIQSASSAAKSFLRAPRASMGRMYGGGKR